MADEENGQEGVEGSVEKAPGNGPLPEVDQHEEPTSDQPQESPLAPPAPPASEDDGTGPVGIQVVGKIPTGEDGFSGEVRFTALVDMTFKDGVLTEIGFNAAQYIAFAGTHGAGVKSDFGKSRR